MTSPFYFSSLQKLSSWFFSLLLTIAVGFSPANEPKPTQEIGCFSVARLKYGGGGDWYAGPTMLPNLMARLKTDLGLPTCTQEHVVEPLSPDLGKYPILFATGHGTFSLTEPEREALRKHLLQGGLLFADDNYGMASSFKEEMKSLFPNRPLKPLRFDHPLFKSRFNFPNGLPKIHQHDGKAATAFGIAQGGRLLVLFTEECDLGNGWEDIGVHPDSPELREKALRMGVNVIAWYLLGAQDPE